MYKLQNNLVKRISDGASIPMVDGNIDYEEYKKWLLDGGVPQPEFTDAELLANTKIAKMQDLEVEFNSTSKLPIKVGTKSYNGGRESARAIRDYIQLVTENGGTEYRIWDVSNIIATYSLGEANAIKLAVATAVANAEFNLRIKKNAVDTATTIAEVEGIVF